MTVPEVTEEEVASLTLSIRTRYGLDFTCYEPKSLKRRIIRILGLFSMTSIHELWVKFLREKDFVQTFMNEISVGMTSMFRDPILWQRLKDKIQSVGTDQTGLSIWHSGCSTGEEVYTMSILLREMNLKRKVKALCTDINLLAIEEAKNGIYHKIKMIENETNYKRFNTIGDFTRYYKPNDGMHVKMDESLLSHAEFSYHNLITDTFPKSLDIVFCRNVMIYFDNGAKQKLLEKFYQALNPGGYFIIGFFDTLGHMVDNKQFELIDQDAKIFQKK